MGRYKKIFSDPNFPMELLDRTKWPTVHEDSLEDQKRELFIQRKKAIDMYLDGEKTIKEICDLSKVNRTDLYRLLSRCVEIDKNGNAFGYKALIPHYRIKDYTRETTIDGFEVIEAEEKKMTGSFQKFLDTHPQIKDEIHNLVFNRNKKKPSQPIPRVKDLHKKFIRLCIREGIKPENGDYPFNTKDFGKRTFYRYVQKIKLNDPYSAVTEYGKDAETLYRNTGVGEQNNIIERPFERVEFDGHNIDAVVVIKYTTLEGDEITDVINRLWLLMIVDTATRVILGYHIVLNKEYSAADVMTCVKNAIMPWSLKKMSIPGLKIPEEGGFASEVVLNTKYAVWDEILFDNALANIAKSVKNKLKKVVNCRVNTGPVGTPTRRPIVEKLFHLLEENGFHKLVNTTGSHPKDPRRQNAEKKAIQFEITPDEIEQLVEVLIASRNGTSQKALNSLTPLETMAQRINRGMPYQLLKEEYRDGYEFLTIEAERVIRGNIETGRRPYIYYEGVDYRNEILAESFDLVGTKITLIVNIEDLRYIKAYLPNGSELGLLKATGKWSIRKHSLKIRKVINKLVAQRELKIMHEDDPIDVYHNHLKEKSKKNKNARSQLAQLEKILNNEVESNQKIESLTKTNVVEENAGDQSSSNVYPMNDKSRTNKAKRSLTNRERLFFNS